jgi:hypothetical protein
VTTNGLGLVQRSRLECSQRWLTSVDCILSQSIRSIPRQDWTRYTVGHAGIYIESHAVVMFPRQSDTVSTVLGMHMDVSFQHAPGLSSWL